MQAVRARRFWMDGQGPVEPLRLRRIPMLLAAAAFAVGDVFARQWHGTMLLVMAAGLLLALSAVAARRAPHLLVLPIFGFMIAAGCWCATLQPPVPQQAALRSYADGLSRTVSGHVERVRILRPQARDDDSAIPVAPWKLEPGAWETDEPDARETVDVAVDTVEQVTPDRAWPEPVDGAVRVTVLGASPVVRCGDLVEVPMRLRLAEIYRDPGAWSYNDQLLSEGVGAIGNVKAGRLRVTGTGSKSWSCRLRSWQEWGSTKLLNYVTGQGMERLPSAMRLNADDAAMLGAMLFGDRARLSSTLRAGFERTGTFHLFVVSGLHVTLLAGALLGLLRKLRLPEAPAVGLTLLAALGYALLTGWGAPVQRALLMTAAYLTGRALGRETTGLNALGTALLALLALNPRVLFEAGFQMTATVILAVAGLAIPVVERILAPWALALRRLELVALDATLSPRQAQFRVRLRLWCALLGDLTDRRLRVLPVWALRALFAMAEALVFGAAIEVCMVLPMAVYFHRATLLGLPVNLLAIPLVALLLSAALMFFLLLLYSAKVALLPGVLVALLLHAVRYTVEHVSHLTLADLRIPSPAPAVLALAAVALLFSGWALRARRQVWFLGGALAAMLVPALVLMPERPRTHPGVLEVTAIDVGQGDSLLVISPQGRTMLVDAGGPNGLSPSQDRWDVGEEVVAPYLWSRRLRRLDVLMLSHAHSDHMGGMPAVLADLRPRELWLGPAPGDAPALSALLSKCRELGIAARKLSAGDTLPWGGTLVEVLAPTRTYANPGKPRNDDSLVVRLGFGKGSVLLAGDAEEPSEQAMLASGRLSPVTLLKVGHHGSRTSTHGDFLAAVVPQAAVISVGGHNTFGHPRREVLSRLEEAHVRTWRTDRAGAHTFLLRPDGSWQDVPAD